MKCCGMEFACSSLKIRGPDVITLFPVGCYIFIFFKRTKKKYDD